MAFVAFMKHCYCLKKKNGLPDNHDSVEHENDHIREQLHEKELHPDDVDLHVDSAQPQLGCGHNTDALKGKNRGYQEQK